MPRQDSPSTQATNRHANMVLATEAPPLDTSKLRYDYSDVAAVHRRTVMTAAVDILTHGNRAKQSIVAMGQRLIEVKALLPEGTFTRWITTEFELSSRMAQNFMNVARQYGDRPEIISVLNDTVLYLLAAPSTPEAAREKVEHAAASGKRVTVGFAKEVIRKAKPEPHTPMATLENMIVEWAYNHAVETNFAHDEVLKFIAEGKTTRADKERGRMAKWLIEQGCHWREGDLEHATKRVWERRQLEARQAQARTVYVEPTTPAIVPEEAASEMRESAERSRRVREDIDLSPAKNAPTAVLAIPMEVQEAVRLVCNALERRAGPQPEIDTLRVWLNSLST